MWRESVSSEVLICGGGVRIILLIVAKCMETIYVCIRRMLPFISVVVTV